MENTLNTNTGSSPTEHAGEMDAATLEALKGSIKKWAAIVDGTGKDSGSTNCPLCKMFNKEERDEEYGEDESACGICPVRLATGKDWCYGTPYIRLVERNGMGDYSHRPGSAGYREIAQAELDFLKSLLPDAAELSKGEKL